MSGHQHHHAHHHHHTHAPAEPHGHPLWMRLVVFALALALIGGLGMLAGHWLAGMAPPVPKSPFGAGLREGGAAPGGISGVITMLQSLFSDRIISGLKEFSRSGEAVWGVLGVSFIYGVVHAAGPGHGKAVIAAYVLASRSALKRGIAMAAAAALLQALVAIALVGLFSILLQATAATLSGMAGQIERVSFAAVALVGAWLLWQKSAVLAALIRPAPPPAEPDHHHHDADCGCGHSHAPMVDAQAGLKEIAMAVVAAGIRPCSGAILVLVFALTQGLFGVGVAAALVMALGTALTTSVLACLAVLARHTAAQVGGGADSLAGRRLITTLEVLAAATVAWLGIAFLLSGI